MPNAPRIPTPAPRIAAVMIFPILLAGFCAATVAGSACPKKGDYTTDLGQSACTFVNTGRTPFWVLEPGFYLQLEGMEGKDLIQNTITTLVDTELIDGVLTRVVEERELANGELIEVSRNYFAICQETSSVFYFGEDVDIYEGGVLVSHDGAWRSGIGGATAGIIMPGTFLLGSRYFQEIAPDVALDRGCNSAMGLAVSTPAGSFTGCVAVSETTPLEKGKSDKVYCPGVGLVNDDTQVLVDWSEKP